MRYKMLTNSPYFKKWWNTNIQRGNGALRPFRAYSYFPTYIACLPLFFNFSMSIIKGFPFICLPVKWNVSGCHLRFIEELQINNHPSWISPLHTWALFSTRMTTSIGSEARRIQTSILIRPDRQIDRQTDIRTDLVFIE